MWTFSLFAALLFSKVCRSYHDITVDDALSPPITYIGRWEPLSEETNDLDTGGAHHVSQDQGAMANFSFTGNVIIISIMSHVIHATYSRCCILLLGTTVAIPRDNLS